MADPGLLAAYGSCAACACVYVGLLYVLSNQKLPRNHPTVIKQRVSAVLLACFITWLPLWLWSRDRQVPPLHLLLGLRWHGLQDSIVAAVYLTYTLFAGVLVYYLYSLSGFGEYKHLLPSNWQLLQWRNYVVAPVTEEFCFRACMVPMLRLAGLSTHATVLLTPLFFGAAHLHHLRELLVHQRLQLPRALTLVACQFAYTTVFGWYATYLFLRTGHLAAPIVAHAICNMFGFPPFGDMSAHKQNAIIGICTLGGLAVFFMQLPRMTRPASFGQTWFE